MSLNQMTWDPTNPFQRNVLAAISAGGVAGGAPDDGGDSGGDDANDGGDGSGAGGSDDSADGDTDGDTDGGAEAGESGDDSILGGKTDKQSNEQRADGADDSEGKSGQEGELEISLPEGMQLSDEQLSAFKDFAKGVGLTGEQASKAAEFQHKLNQEAVQAWAEKGKAWATEIKEDPKYGGDNLATTVANARKAVDLGGEPVRTLLDDLGVGNHPALVRWLADLGEHFQEDRGPGGAGGSSKATEADTLARIYNKSQEHLQ